MENRRRGLRGGVALEMGLLGEEEGLTALRECLTQANIPDDLAGDIHSAISNIESLTGAKPAVEAVTGSDGVVVESVVEVPAV